MDYEGKDYPRLWWEYGQAFSPDPADGAIDVVQTGSSAMETWRTGLQHDVYFGDDEAGVANATTETPGIYRGRQPAEMTNL